MKIPAFRIEVNGELVAVAGAPELSLLTGQVAFGAGPNRTIDMSGLMLSVMGLDMNDQQPRQLTWANEVQLKLGDRVTFEIAEVAEADLPGKILKTPSSAELAESARDEKRKARSS
jgi:hypothetical protein